MISRGMQAMFVGAMASLAGLWACGSGGDGTTSTSTGSSMHGSSSSASSSGGGGSLGMGNVGLACTADGDCGAPFKCILPTDDDPFFGGGPANGYCSKSCTDDADCPSGALCAMGNGGAGTCVATCEIGPVLVHINDPLDPTKCQGRSDLACTPLDATTTVCLPSCGEDSQCPAGRACDPRKSVCVPAASVSTGLPTGASCDPKAATNPCAAFCIDGLSICGQSCTIGGDVRNGSNCGGVTKGICAFLPMSNGAGDVGVCAKACTAYSDCATPAFACFPISGLTGTGAGQIPNGFCFDARPCPKGASDCASDTGTTCTQTSSGAYCIPNAFPIHTNDGGVPDDGGGSDGGADMDAGTGDDAGDGG